ncbi:CidA/LrgA family protein [Melaminivora suipulveris]|uniref:CidA/LrgA family protein n=1 Tax=Melaminivora suipulveris TaxID=2109913 RepID=A0A2R3QF54_9BURK|nr:CidA/LrgA family protein [Melaminivora suipulveris]AVO50314.1 CidA/LrgA family protein [Melaminivora suipulveris]
MLYAFTALVAFQLIGDLLVQWLNLPLPGPLAGMLLLLVALLILGRVPEALERLSTGLLQNMMLLFIPSVAGVMLHFDHIAREWLPFLVSGIVGAGVTFAVTAWTMRRVLHVAPEAPAPAAPAQPGSGR